MEHPASTDLPNERSMLVLQISSIPLPLCGCTCSSDDQMSDSDRGNASGARAEQSHRGAAVRTQMASAANLHDPAPPHCSMLPLLYTFDRAPNIIHAHRPLQVIVMFAVQVLQFSVTLELVNVRVKMPLEPGTVSAQGVLVVGTGEP